MHMQFVLISCANSTTQLGRRTFVSLMAALRTCGARQLFESRWRCDVLINYNTSETLRLLRTRCVRGTALERDGCCFFFLTLCAPRCSMFVRGNGSFSFVWCTFALVSYVFLWSGTFIWCMFEFGMMEVFILILIWYVNYYHFLIRKNGSNRFFVINEFYINICYS